MVPIAKVNRIKMGDHNVHTATNEKTRLNFTRNLLDDLEALDQMLREGKIESGIVRIGAEQEFCLVNQNWRPAAKALPILKSIKDHHFTTELARYNLELNLDPVELTGDAFTRVENQLTRLLRKAEKAATEQNTKIVLTGILPSISTYELRKEFMTPMPRYRALNEMMRKLRGTHFHLHLSGVDELSIKHSSVMFEACNTSFQMHLQIEPEDFTSSYNWAQAISGPVLGLCVNSPLLLGRELWAETRIALFQQSIDTRGVTQTLRDQPSRIAFGDNWINGTIADIFKNEISRHKIILSKHIEENALEKLKSGDIPKLQAACLYNGTLYHWNRACYGVGNGKAHVRIENRYIPAGPTILDEMANFAFWVGLMSGRPSEFDHLPGKMSFKDAKANFIKAARTGSESIMAWMGEEIELNKLVLTRLLPIARQGLEKRKISKPDIDRLLAVIEARAQSHTAAQWMTRSYRKLRTALKPNDAVIALTKSIFDNQQTGQPAHEWPRQSIPPIVQGAATKVGHIMTTQVVTAYMNDMAELTLRIMEWKNIHHLPIVDHKERLVGLLTWTHMQRFNKKKRMEDYSMRVSEVMEPNVCTAEPSTPILEAIALMKEKAIGCLPVIQKKQLAGIITIKDVLEFDKD